MSAITVEGLSFSYEGGAQAVRAVDLGVSRGKATVLLGPNGSGKSTLLSLLLGYLEPGAGSISILGKPLASYRPRELGRLLAFLSSETYVPFNYSVTEYVLLGRSAHRPSWAAPTAADRDSVATALSRAGVERLRNRNIQELSSGELQLVSVARALAQEPEILLMDEPTSHLDPANAVSVFRLIRALAGEGLTVLFTSHDPQHARQVADEAVLLESGRVVAAGQAAATLSAKRLSELYGVRFLEASLGERRIPFAEL
ncbi:MAG: ABC transporter ATP-binding protein [Alkalispirochaetaceae bacterium]